MSEPIIHLQLPDWMDGHTVPLRPDPVIGGFPASSVPSSLRRLHVPTGHQRFLRIVRPFHRARLKRNIKAWLPMATKDPRSVEAEFVSNWSFELRYIFGE